MRRARRRIGILRSVTLVHAGPGTVKTPWDRQNQGVPRVPWDAERRPRQKESRTGRLSLSLTASAERGSGVDGAERERQDLGPLRLLDVQHDVHVRERREAQFMYVSDVRRTDQFPLGHSVRALGVGGGGRLGENVICPLCGVMGCDGPVTLLRTTG